MVHAKKKSGDPDYDDKVPMDDHAGGEVVKDIDGKDARVTETVGPITSTGAHAVLEDQDLGEGEGDNRPAPGDVATEASTVQKYEGDDLRTAAASPKGRKGA